MGSDCWYYFLHLRDKFFRSERDVGGTGIYLFIQVLGAIPSGFRGRGGGIVGGCLCLGGSLLEEDEWDEG